MAAAAAGLTPRHGPAKGLPRLLFLTDPARTPDPEAVVARLPPGVGVIFRAFGANDAVDQGRRLRALTRQRGLILLAGADPDLALAIAADGLHLPQRSLADLPARRAARPDWILTAAAHDRAAAVAAAKGGADAVLVSPVFASNSPSAGAPLGVGAFTAIVEATPAPVYALGGVTAVTSRELAASGAAGFAAIEAFLEP
ncbi:MAG: thiamine monophosphate synthase [Caulobacter sp.]|nr:thiamine monophosphate synthase [Caulobacter sp.]